MKIGFIGQGWIGKNYADDFESRGYKVVRYALEEKYIHNKEKIAECDIVFIAVPTPTTKDGFSDSTIRNVMKLIGKGKTAVIKSTILPGTTEKMQKDFPDIYITHSPEFLREATASYDASHPDRNIVGIPKDDNTYRKIAQEILDILPNAPYKKIMNSKDAEFVKYASNCFLFTKVIFMNLLYDLIDSSGGDWKSIRKAFINDPRIGSSHTEPIHKTGRGAGGNCFIKDFEAFRLLYSKMVEDQLGKKFFEIMKDKNIELLTKSGKDLDTLKKVYGKN